MQNCLRCNNEIEKNESGLCVECETLVNQALELIETDTKIALFYESAINDQTKASVRLEKVKYQYNNSDKQSLLKKTGRGLAKVYHFSFLDLFTKKFKQDPSISREEAYINEIMQLEDFISIDPIEFVIYEYIIPEEEKNLGDGKLNERNFVTNAYNVSMTQLFSKLDQKKQVQFSIAFIVIVAVLLSIVIFI